MSKRTFIWFGILVVVLAVVIPWLAFRSKGDEIKADCDDCWLQTRHGHSRPSGSTWVVGTGKSALASAP